MAARRSNRNVQLETVVGLSVLVGPGVLGGVLQQLGDVDSARRRRPGAGPVAVKKHLEPFLPLPRLKYSGAGYEIDAERPDSIGRMRSFHNNFGMIVRAYAYILALGGDGLGMASRLRFSAELCRKRLQPHFPSATGEPSMHECVLSHDLEKRADVSTLEIAKRLLDFGIHPPTIYFPLVVPGALMIEPTETESKQILDSFVDTMERIYDEALTDPSASKTPRKPSPSPA